GLEADSFGKTDLSIEPQTTATVQLQNGTDVRIHATVRSRSTVPIILFGFQSSETVGAADQPLRRFFQISADSATSAAPAETMKDNSGTALMRGIIPGK